jgi:hypothetical protein
MPEDCSAQEVARVCQPLTEEWQSPDEVYNYGPTVVPVSLVTGSAVKEPETMIDQTSESSKERGAKRLLRALKKIAYDDLRGRRKHEKETKHDYVHRAFITIEDEVGIKHLAHRVNQREEYQTTIAKPHELRKSLIRSCRLKGLRWNLFKVGAAVRTRLPKLFQSLENGAE